MLAGNSTQCTSFYIISRSFSCTLSSISRGVASKPVRHPRPASVEPEEAFIPATPTTAAALPAALPTVAVPAGSVSENLMAAKLQIGQISPLILQKLPSKIMDKELQKLHERYQAAFSSAWLSAVELQL